jgi:hypothetical protein
MALIGVTFACRKRITMPAAYAGDAAGVNGAMGGNLSRSA